MTETSRKSRPLALIRRGRWGRRHDRRGAEVDGPIPQTMRSIEYGGTRWVDVRHPNAEQVEVLGRDFELHPLTIEDIKSHIQRPKLDETQMTVDADA